jgi:hypothetical protein
MEAPDNLTDTFIRRIESESEIQRTSHPIAMNRVERKDHGLGSKPNHDGEYWQSIKA